jgi:HlyD family secretion protein
MNKNIIHVYFARFGNWLSAQCINPISFLKKLSPRKSIAYGSIVIAAVLFGYFNLANRSVKPVVNAASHNAALAFADEELVEGKVVPLKHTSLSFAAPGVVEELLAAEGDSVQAGETLAVLKGKQQAEAAIRTAEYEVLAANQELEAFTDRAAVDTASAQLELARAKTKLDDAQENRERQEYRLTSDLTLNTIHANYMLAEDELRKANDEFAGLKDRAVNDLERAAALSKLSAAQQKRDKTLSNLNEALKKPDANKVGEADARLALAKAAFNDAQKQFNKVKDGPDSEKLKILQEKLRSAKAHLAAAQAGLDNLYLRAPFSGVILGVDIKSGEAVNLNPVIHVADTTAWMVETTDLNELEIVGVQEDTPAIITIDAIPDLELAGKVVRINRFGEDRDGDILYTVTIALDQPDPRLMWNMTAFVRLLTHAQ